MPGAIATHSACRCRSGLPEALLSFPPQCGCGISRRRYARTHGPFTTLDFATRYGLGRGTAETILTALSCGRQSCSRVSSGPAGPAASGAIRTCSESIRRRSLARLRRQVEPVDPAVFGRLLTRLAGGRPAARRPRCAPRRDGEPRGGAPACLHLRIGDSRRPGPRVPAPPTSMRSRQLVKWCGADSNRSAIVTAGAVAAVSHRPVFPPSPRHPSG